MLMLSGGVFLDSSPEGVPKKVTFQFLREET